LKEFDVLATYINGIKVSSENQSLIKRHVLTDEPINHFLCREVTQQELLFEGEGGYPYPVIECVDGQLVTLKSTLLPTMRDDFFESNTTSDVLKIVLVNRYHPASIAKAFIHGFGLKHGAIASSVAHDSHNIIALGVDDKSIMKSINLIIAQRGGISCVAGDIENVLSLNVAGLMSDGDGYEVAHKYTELDAMAKLFGSTLSAPFMSLSFMALLVIPHVKLSDKGIFDGDQFKLYAS
jgi:adenine deaminase